MKVLLVVAFLGAVIPKIISQNACGGRMCNSDQYCEDEKECKDKKGLGEDCGGMGQCKPANSDCVEDKCQCNEYWAEGPGSQCVYSCNSGSCSKNQFCSEKYPEACLPQKNLNEGCDKEETSEGQCKSTDATCDVDSEKCTCKTGFWEEGGQCIGKCTNSNSCQIGEFCDVDGDGKCLPLRYLGEDCPQPDACFPIPNSECNSIKMCDCKVDYVNYHNSACLAKCTVGECIKDDEFCNSESFCSKKANFNETCDDQSSENSCALENTSCRIEDAQPAKCLCSTGFGEFNGICVKACDISGCDVDQFCNSEKVCEAKRNLGGQCDKNEEKGECLEANAICANGRCSCDDTYYQNGMICAAKCTSNAPCDANTEFCSLNLGRCTPLIDLNGLCSKSDVDPCKDSEAECHPEMSQCLCKDAFVETAGTCIAKCKSNDECTTPGTFCNSKTGSCDMKLALNQTCSIDEANLDDPQCQDPEAECSTGGLCSCKDSHVENNLMCTARCKNAPAVCSNAQYCDSESDTDICKPKVQLGQDCKYADQCFDAEMKDAECNMGTSKCECSGTDYNYNGLCLLKCTAASCSSGDFCNPDGECQRLKPLGGSCSAAIECKTPDAICDQVCKCSSDFHQEPQICILKCTKENEVCDSSKEFCFLLEQKCYGKTPLNGQCLEEGLEGDCFGKLTNCLREENSQRKTCKCVPNSDGTDGGENGCSCNSKFVEDAKTTRCLEEAEKISDPCEEPQQCYSLTPGLEDGSGTTCNDVCMCNKDRGYLDSTNKTKCLKVAENLYEQCEESVQCPFNSTTCNANKCSCLNGFIAASSNKDCLELATAVEEPCSEVQQCSEIGDTELEVECTEDKCKCRNGFLGSTDKMTCVKGNNNAASPRVDVMTLIFGAFLLIFKYAV